MEQQEYLTLAQTYAVDWGTKIALAIIVFIVGKFLAGLVHKALVKMMKTAKVNEILIDFLGTVANTTLTLLVVIVALSQLGVDTTSLVALLGAAGLAVGLALKDTLAHFAAGVMLIVFRPFKLGDFVEVGGQAGSVAKITVFSTELKTPDNVLVTIPNGEVFGSTMKNYSASDQRRIDLVIGVSYDANLQLTKNLLGEILDSHPAVLKDPAYTVAVAELADSSVNLVVRPWVNASDYWSARFEIIENIKTTLDANDIGIPYPQMDVYLNKLD